MSTKITIANLKCGGCANSIKKGIVKIAGVGDVSVDLETSEVVVSTEEETIIEQVKERLASMGYPEINDENTLIHKAKSFVSCATGRMTSET